MTRVVVAADKFKGSLDASQVARAVAAGLRRRAGADLDVVDVPVADGGDGTLDAVVSAGYTLRPVVASGPTGRPVETAYAALGSTAVVELAAVCGLAQLPGGYPEPLRSSSYGLGQVIAAALAGGATHLVVGIGGSASTDGGAGMLTALGARILDAAGHPVPPGGAALAGAASLDLRGLDPRIAAVEVTLACDVDNPLVGPHGAAAVYGPQKGATAGDIATLDAALRRWAEVVAAATGTDLSAAPGAGAAGGVGLGALAVLGATMRPGIDLVLQLLGFEELVRGARLVVTGEGSLDEQTLHGKVVTGVAARAAAAGVPTVAVAGRVLLAGDQMAQAGITKAYALSDLQPDPVVSMRDAGPLVERAAERIADDWLLDPAGDADGSARQGAGA
ncbi:MAG TPA: glycerate kinase [Acidimicrobiales bacterium]|nr:glycerate kinase [Acidimicrobiales bacterium]